MSVYDSFIRVAINPEPGYEWFWNKYEFLDRLTDGFCVIYPGNYEEYISPKICELLGYSLEELGRTVKDLKRFIPKEDFENFSYCVEKLINKDELSLTTNKRLKAKDGTYRLFEVTCAWDGPYIVSIYRLILEK